ncbi:MAG: hypothetical protein JSV80_17240, partial [Acidobacteriota bacterium]
MADRPHLLVKRLDTVKDQFGSGGAETKLELLQQLARRRLHRAADVYRFHECLCFLRAHPDSQAVLDAVEQLLSDFPSRSDLRRHRKELADTGIAGTPIHYRFFWSTAKWLARRWPDQMTIDWGEFENRVELDALVHLLAPFGEFPALDMFDAPLDARGWIERLKASSETDAAFLMRRFAGLHADEFLRDALYERLDVPLRIAPSTSGPSRTRAHYSSTPVVFQTQPLARTRPSLRSEIRRFRMSVRTVSPREGQALIDLWREALVTRHRDTLAAEYADNNDVRLVSADRGLQFAFFGVVPARRPVLETLYGYLSLRNGVPIGYGT